MALLVSAGKGEQRYRQFTVKADGTAVNLTGLKVTCYLKRDYESWSQAKSINTTDNAANIVLADATNGVVELRPGATWFGEAGTYHLMFRIAASPPYDAPDSANGPHIIIVEDAP